ncbi:MAG: phenylalanine--tRNA ligase subunit alpha, partial [Schleiferiaceae bacterium]
MSTIDQLTAKALQQIADAGDLDALDALRVALLGKSGEITLQLKQLGGGERSGGGKGG